MEESTEILTIFPWYNYLLAVFIFALGVIAVRRRIVEPSRWGKMDTLGLLFSIGIFFLQPVQNLARGGVFKVIDTGYPAFRFVKDVVVNNNEVLDEQARMAQLAGMKDSWHVLAVKPKYHLYVVVIGESARRDALGAFGGHWDNTPFASSVNGYLFNNYIAASGSTQKSLGLTLNRVVDGKPQYQDNFVTLANRAGFQTSWFSNRGQIGEYDTAIASIAKRADEVQFLKNGDFEANKTPGRAVAEADRAGALNPAYPAAADCPAPDGLSPTGLRSDQGQIHGFRSVERDLMLPLQHDADRFAAG